jgi:hypothetical protein
MAGRNIEIILGGLVDAVRNQDPGRITDFLAADLVWEGLEPGLRCDGREQAVGVIRNRFAAAPLTVEAVEAIDAGQHVIVGLRGPGFNGTLGDLDTVGQIYTTSSPSATVRSSAGVTTSPASKPWPPRAPATCTGSKARTEPERRELARPHGTPSGMEETGRAMAQDRIDSGTTGLIAGGMASCAVDETEIRPRPASASAA